MPSINPGLEFESKFLENVFINPACIDKISQEIIDKINDASFFGENDRNKIDWILLAIKLIDLTTLGGDDSRTNVSRLCHTAVNPIPKSLQVIAKSKFAAFEDIKCAAVCVYPACVAFVSETLALVDPEQRRPNIAAVATGFPTGLFGLDSRLEEIRFACREGANEIDIVIQRHLVLSGQWRQLYDEIRRCKETCAEFGACMKTILSTGELGSLSNVYKASMIAMMAGSDFIKTSTGKEGVNATLTVGLVMCRAINHYYRLSGGSVKVGLKPAGGLKTSKHAFQWMYLVQSHLGADWLNPSLFRIGASSLLDDLLNELSCDLRGRNVNATDYLEQ